MKHLKTILTVLLALAMMIPASMGTLAAGDGTDEYLYLRSGYLSEGQVNIVRRARQLVEIQWTPVYDLHQWGYDGTFKAGTTYTGAPYGQPVHTAYIGYGATLSEFLDACEDSGSKMYSEYSYYSKVAPYYSTDCSGFVSYCWALEERETTREIPDVAELVEDQSINGLEVGDCLNNSSTHAVLVTGVVRDGSGEVVLIETMEQTPPKAKRTVYGAGNKLSLDYFNSYYLANGGYRIYRYPDRDSVTYTHDCAVPLDGDYCSRCRDRAPSAVTTYGSGYKSVELRGGSGAVIYYTTDGSMPTLNSEVYTSPLYFEKPAMLRAMAWTGNFDGARILSYYVGVEACALPGYSVSGMSEGTAVSCGSKITLTCETSGAKIYYTTGGGDPLAEGTLYTGPITIETDTEIRAAARADGYRDSGTAIFDFTVKNFSNFNDVAPDAWYAAAVNYAYGMGIFNGTSEGVFSPDGEMTRGMFITVLGRMAGVTSETSCELGLVAGDSINLRSAPDANSSVLATLGRGYLVRVLSGENGWYQVAWDELTGYISAEYLSVYAGAFWDVDTASYYSPYVQWAYLMGISRGTGSGTFNPDGLISRQDLAAMLYNYSKVMGISLNEVNSGVWFADDASISPVQKEAVYALGRAGIINGMGDGSFNPGGSATRAQVAQIMMNFIK